MNVMILKYAVLKSRTVYIDIIAFARHFARLMEK